MLKFQMEVMLMKKKILHTLDRRKYSANQNIRLGMIALCIVYILGTFLPMLQVQTKLSIVNEDNNKSEIEIFNPSDDLISITSNDLTFHKDLKDFEVFGYKIGDIDLFGVKIYDLLLTEIPSFDNIKNLEEFLNSDAIDSLISDDFINFSNNYLRSFGNSIISLGNTLHEFAVSARDVLHNVNQKLDKLQKISNEIRQGIESAENSLSTVQYIYNIFFIIIFAFIIFMIIGKGPKLLGQIGLSVISFVFIAFLISIGVINSIVSDTINSGISGLESSFFEWINSIFPIAFKALSLFSIDSYRINFSVDIFSGAGMWIMTFAIISLTALGYIKYFLNKKRKI